MGKRGKIHKLVIVWLILFLTGSTAFAGVCKEGQIELRGEWGSARFTVEVADTASERSQGLMNRQSMAKSAGMLFVYPSPRTVGFWMKNTLIPLDMIFMDATGTVQRVHENAVPLDLTMIPGGQDIQYVLEINAGMAKRFGISVGSEAKHPSIEQAAWPC